MNALVKYKGPGALVRGSGGMGGGDAAHTPVEAPNTLQSRSYAVIMDIVSEGPIFGLATGDGQSVFLNDTPLLSSSGAPSFSGVWLSVAQGYPNQSAIAGLPGNDVGNASYVTAVSTPVLNGAPGPIVRTIDDENANAVLVTLSVAEMISTNVSNGDINPTAVQIAIYTRIGGTATWILVTEDTIAGKTTTTYERQYRVNRPAGSGDWQIQVARITPDSTTASTVNGVTWDSYSVVYDNLFVYPNTAYVAMMFDATLFGSQLPSRKFLIKGLLLNIPSNYDPIARTYTGIWDGTFQIAWSNNPAWVFYDLVTNNRYGAGEIIPAAIVDKWGLYAIAQYCDEPVPDGLGGYEPRYVFNGVLDRADDALKMMQSIASMFDAICFANSQTVTCVQDRPGSAVRLLTTANVAEGTFSYEGTALSSRPTAARAQFIDPLDNYNPAIEIWEDPVLVSKWGYIPVDLQLIGVTSRGQANRKAHNLIDMSWTSGEIVTYTVGLDQIDTQPGDYVVISDQFYQGIRYGGRVLASPNNQQMAIDSPVVLDATSEWSVFVVYPDGTVDQRSVNVAPAQYGVESSYLVVGLAPVTGNILTQPFSQIPVTNSVWMLTRVVPSNPGASIAPRIFKVLTVTDKTPYSFEVKAVYYDPNRRLRVEDNIYNPPGNFSYLTTLADTVPPPTNMTAGYNLTGIGNTTIARATLSWTPPKDPRVQAFEIQAINSEQVYTYYQAKQNAIEIDGLPADTYSFSARSLTLDARVSIFSNTATLNITGVSDNPAAPTAFTAQGGTRKVLLNWVNPTQRDINYVEIYRSNSAGSAISLIATVAAQTFTDNDGDTLVPLSTWYYYIRCVTTTGALGAFAGPVSATTTQLLVDDLEDGIINTAKFAQGIVFPVLYGTAINPSEVGLPANPSAVNGAVLIYNTNDSVIYRWNGTAWAPAKVYYNEIIGQLIAGQIAAGAIGADQIAAKSLYAYHLADTFQLTETAQIGTAIITNAKIANLAVGVSNVQDGAITASGAFATPGIARANMPLGGPGGGGADEWRVLWQGALDPTGSGGLFSIFSYYMDKPPNPQAQDEIVVRIVRIDNSGAYPLNGVFDIPSIGQGIITYQFQIGFFNAANEGNPLFYDAFGFFTTLKK